MLMGYEGKQGTQVTRSFQDLLRISKHNVICCKLITTLPNCPGFNQLKFMYLHKTKTRKHA